MHIAVLMANTDDSAFAQTHPDDGAKFRALLQSCRPDWWVTVFSVKDGEFPPEGARFEGWLITGSPASVNGDEAWIGRLMGLIRRLVAEDQPLFGACFGHQAIAKALGGPGGRKPRGLGVRSGADGDGRSENQSLCKRRLNPTFQPLS